MKSFYSCLDPFVIAPQVEQHNLIKSMAEKENGKIVFYGSEDFFVAPNNGVIISAIIVGSIAFVLAIYSTLTIEETHNKDLDFIEE